MLSNGLIIQNVKKCDFMQYSITALLTVLTYEICSAPLHIMRKVNAEEHRKKENK